jgi:phosphoglycerol transferase MdoB-like AlkP superfamily enzyme
MRVFPRLWALVLLLLPVCSLSRAELWLSYSGTDRPVSALAPALAQGLRFDLVLGAGMSIAIAFLVWPLQPLRRWPSLPARAAAFLGTVVLAVTTLAAVCEHYYYSFYQSRFDPMVFGLFDDDTIAVLQTIWSGYPVLPVLGVVVLVVLALGWALRRLAAWLDERWPALRWPRVFVVLQILAFVLLARGSFGLFPLTRQDLTLSPDPFVNSLVHNPPLSLYKAYRANDRQVNIGRDPAEGLKGMGFASLGAAAQAAGMDADGPEDVATNLFTTAPGVPRPLSKSPHVVLALLESFGADLLYYDGPTNDMLGRLRPQLARGYHFSNFMTGRNGTGQELEYLLLGSPISPLTQGHYGSIALDTSAVLPFRRAGYRTALVYAGGASWRNLGHAFHVQGFDRVYDSRDIKIRFPAARGSEWGLYDQYLFDYAAELLEQADARGERLFLFLLTTTNHPPYLLETPHPDLPLDPGLLGTRAEADKVELRKTLATYQYQADQFGAFLERITRGPLGQRLVLAAAGDHNLRTHFRYDLPAEQPDVDRVFAFLYVPDELRPVAPPDVRAFCGHGDIIPTLVSLALPGQRYFDTGRNLLAPVDGQDFAVVSHERLYTAEGVLFPLRKPAVHAWVDDRHVDIRGGAATPPQLELAGRIRGRVALQDWHIRRQVIASRKNGRSTAAAGFNGAAKPSAEVTVGGSTAP